MNAKVEVESSGLDTFKLVIATALLIGGITGFYHFDQYSQLLRVVGLIGIALLASFVALQTMVGRSVWSFAVDSRAEVRKVVWPTRQETIQTTLLVISMVFVMAVVLWLVDMLLMWIVRAITG